MFAALCSARAQVTWQKQLPGGGNFTPFCQLVFEDGQFLIKSSSQLFRVNTMGEITGNLRLPNSNIFMAAALERYAAGTGHPYFIIAHRNISPDQGYTLAEYRPGKGLFQETVFQDSLGSISNLRPKIVALNDSIFVVFGGKFYRKIKFSPNAGFAEIWNHPLPSPVADALLYNNQMVVADDAGTVYALDTDGNTLWSKSTGFVFRTLRPVSGGWIGCVRNTADATIVKLDPGGDVLWNKTTADAGYFEAAGTPDGGFVVAGTSDAARITLVKFNFAGDQLWKQEYSGGAGTGVLTTAGGGFVVMGRKNANLYLIRTNENGDAPPLEEALIESRQIKTAGIAATLSPSPSLFFNDNDATLISPPDSAATVLSFAPWIGGLDETGQLRMATATYAPYVEPDYRSGFRDGRAPDFNRVWLAKRDEINLLRLDFGPDQTLDQQVPFDLLTWPAKGNPHFRYNLDFSPVETDAMLFPAPFTDANGDGIYNVYDGDYPRIRGEQMAWWILTDSTAHESTQGNILGVDLGVSAYVFGCTQNTTVEQSLFVDLEVVNRSQTDYQNTFLGFFTDPDLGCFEDDFFGSLPDNNTFYIYNLDDTDDVCPAGIKGFGSNIPVQTVTFMNQSLDRIIYFNNPVIGNPLPATADPGTINEYYNLLQGKWVDGTPLTTGGTGYNPGSTDYANHAFPGNPSNLQGWSMCTAPPPYNDQRIISSHGPFSFASGDTFRISTAFTLHFNVPLSCPNIQTFVKPQIEQLQQGYDDGSLAAAVDLGGVVLLPAGGQLTLNAGVPGAVSYLWSTGANTPVIDVNTPGEYSVVVTLASGCQITDKVLVQLDTRTSQPGEIPSWSVAPNPVGDMAWVECAGCRDERLEVVVRNAQGAWLATESGQNKRVRLEMGNRPPGFYWLELWQSGRFLGARKLVLSGN